LSYFLKEKVLATFFPIKSSGQSAAARVRNIFPKHGYNTKSCPQLIIALAAWFNSIIGAYETYT
jgi:hypothetical protein